MTWVSSNLVTSDILMDSLIDFPLLSTNSCEVQKAQRLRLERGASSVDFIHDPSVTDKNSTSDK